MSGAKDFNLVADDLNLDSQNPWPGLTAFTEKQHEFFYGREQESHELFQCVKRERLTVLFGKSGLGKTSLLQAGLFPQLRDAAYLPVYVRLSYADGAAPVDFQLRTALESAIKVANFAEVALPQDGESTWEYLHRRGGNLINDDGEIVTPVLIFDQFEECFTLGARKDFTSRLTGEFLPGLAEMIENRTPAALTKKLTEDRDLARRYDLEAIGCRILITLREDYLANLEALRDSMPSLVFVDNRMRLTEMTGKQALSVVADPSPDLVDDDVAELIVRFVAGSHAGSPDGDARPGDVLPLSQLEIAPAILSLFCSQLNEGRLKQRMPRITRELVMSQGITIIDDFYKKCIDGMHPAVRRLIEDQLLTTAGYRDNIDLAQARRNLELAGASSSSIDDLVRLRLLQIEEHRGVSRLELTHDVLADPVKRSRAQWEQEQAREHQQQQEHDALMKAKLAEQEAAKRAHFLQKMVAGAALVIVLLTVVVVFGWVERERANSSAEKAALNADNAARETARAVAMEKQDLKDAGIAHANEAQAKYMGEQDKLDAATAKANEVKAEKSASLALEKQKDLTDVSSKTLDHCVTLYQTFDTAADREQGDEGKNVVRELYEHFLMDDGQCFSLAKKLHEDEPDNIEITDPLTMIPLRAAFSASERKDKKAVQDYVNRALQQVDALESKGGSTDMDLLTGRAYTVSATVLSFVGDDTAQATDDHGMKIIASLKIPATAAGFNTRQWDDLSDAYFFDALFYQSSEQGEKAIQPFKEAYDAEKNAASLEPKSTYYADRVLDRADSLADYEKGLNTHDEEALGWYKTSLALATQLSDRDKIAEIYTNMRIILVRDKKYDEAHQLLDQRIKELLAKPENVQRQRDLMAAYDNSAEIDEARTQWTPAVGYRAHAVDAVAGLKPDDYDDQPVNLIDAYLDLAWAEIYDGQTDKGIADVQKGISLSESTKGHPDLRQSYDNGVKALVNNKKYDEALKLLNQRIQGLLADPRTIQRERDLATAYSTSAETEEDKEQFTQAVDFRQQAVNVLSALRPEDYDDQVMNLIDAISDLSWDEIFAGQTDKGQADIQKAIKLSEATDGQPSLGRTYRDGARALTLNKKYDAAETLLDGYTQWLLKSPAGTQRERDLASVDSSKASTAETAQDWQKGVDYLADEVKILSALDPKSYDGQRTDLATAYGTLSWMEERAGRFADGLRDAKAGLALDAADPDSTKAWMEINEAHGLLFTGQAAEAKALYEKVKDLRRSDGSTIVTAIGEDYRDLCQAGYTRPEMTGIIQELGVKNADMDKCMAARAQK